MRPTGNFADGLTPSDQGQAGMVLRSRCREEASADGGLR